MGKTTEELAADITIAWLNAASQSPDPEAASRAIETVYKGAYKVLVQTSPDNI